MEKKYIQDKEGVQILPITHISAVRDDAGNTLDSILSNNEQALLNESNRAKAAENDRYTKSETYTKTEVHNLITTPNQEYVTVSTYESLPASGSEDTIYRVSNYNGSTSQVDETSYSEYAWNGSNYVFLCVKSQIDEVFDITAYNSNTKYADLAAALGTNGANIPQNLRKGGMSVKFVQSSDNKYVEWRLKTQDFSLVLTDWENIDDIQKSLKGTIQAGLQNKRTGMLNISADAWINTTNNNLNYIIIDAKAGDNIKIKAGTNAVYFAALSAIDTPSTSAQTGWTGRKQVNANDVFYGTVPSDATHIYIQTLFNGADTIPLQLIIGKYDYAKLLKDNSILYTNNEVTPYMFGAIGDGETDDTDAFKAAISALNTLNGTNTLTIPAGTYLLSDTLLIPHTVHIKTLGNVELKGSFSNKPIIQYYADYDIPDEPKMMTMGQPLIYGGLLKLINTSDSSTTAGLIIGDLTAPSAVRPAFSRTIIENIRCSGFNFALQIGPYNTYMLTFRNISTEECENGIQFGASGVTQSVNSFERITFVDSNFAGNSAALYWLSGWLPATFINCSFDHNHYIMVHQQEGTFSRCHFDAIGCHFERVGYADDYENNGAFTGQDWDSSEISFAACRFYLSTADGVMLDTSHYSKASMRSCSVEYKSPYPAYDTAKFIEGRIILDGNLFPYTHPLTGKCLNVDPELATGPHTAVFVGVGVQVGPLIMTSYGANGEESPAPQYVFFDNSNELNIPSGRVGLKTRKISVNANETYYYQFRGTDCKLAGNCYVNFFDGDGNVIAENVAFGIGTLVSEGNIFNTIGAKITPPDGAESMEINYTFKAGKVKGVYVQKA